VASGVFRVPNGRSQLLVVGGGHDCCALFRFYRRSSNAHVWVGGDERRHLFCSEQTAHSPPLPSVNSTKTTELWVHSPVIRGLLFDR
jgi:hypothetical protein